MPVAPHVPAFPGDDALRGLGPPCAGGRLDFGKARTLRRVRNPFLRLPPSHQTLHHLYDKSLQKNTGHQSSLEHVWIRPAA